MWAEIIYPFPNFNVAAIKVWEWISIFIPHLTGHVIIYPCWWKRYLMGMGKARPGTPHPPPPTPHPHSHYNDVIIGAIASQITSLTIVYSTDYSDIKNIKAPRHWHLCGEFTGTGVYPAQMASNAENVSIWRRHHAMKWSSNNIQFG